MRHYIGKRVFVAASAMFPLAGPAWAQPPAVPVSGAELQAWFAADEMAVAGVGIANGCHFINKGPGTARRQTVYCPAAAPFTVIGEARVDGNRLCSKFVYPDGSRYEGCQEIFKVGENKFEARMDGAPRTVFYRLVR